MQLLLAVLLVHWPVHSLQESPKLATVVSFTSVLFRRDYVLTILQMTKTTRMTGRLLQRSDSKACQFFLVGSEVFQKSLSK